MDVKGSAFKYLKEKFGNAKTDAKIKAHVFIGPEIRDLIKDQKFDESLSESEKLAWQAFVMVI